LPELRRGNAQNDLVAGKHQLLALEADRGASPPRGELPAHPGCLITTLELAIDPLPTSRTLGPM
jgi:hypothetical protein